MVLLKDSIEPLKQCSGSRQPSMELGGTSISMELCGLIATLHIRSSTKEKPSYLLFSMDCCSPTEAALLPPKSLRATEISDYREELVTTIPSARALTLKFNWKSQQQYKHQHDKKATTPKLCIGDWFLYISHKTRLEMIGNCLTCGMDHIG